MSVRRDVLLPSVVLSTLAGLLQFNGYRILHETLDLSAGDATFQAANVAIQLVDFGVAVGLPVALGYWVGVDADLREEYRTLAAVVTLGALVGYAASAGVTLLVTDPGQVRFPMLYLVPTLLFDAVRFAVAVVAGAAFGYFGAVRFGTNPEVARPE